MHIGYTEHPLLNAVGAAGAASVAKLLESGTESICGSARGDYESATAVTAGNGSLESVMASVCASSSSGSTSVNSGRITYPELFGVVGNGIKWPGFNGKRVVSGEQNSFAGPAAAERSAGEGAVPRAVSAFNYKFGGGAEPATKLLRADIDYSAATEPVAEKEHCAEEATGTTKSETKVQAEKNDAKRINDEC